MDSGRLIPLYVSPHQFKAIRELEAKCMTYGQPFNEALFLEGVQTIIREPLPPGNYELRVDRRHPD